MGSSTDWPTHIAQVDDPANVPGVLFYAGRYYDVLLFSNIPLKFLINCTILLHSCNTVQKHMQSARTDTTQETQHPDVQNKATAHAKRNDHILHMQQLHK